MPSSKGKGQKRKAESSLSPTRNACPEESNPAHPLFVESVVISCPTDPKFTAPAPYLTFEEAPFSAGLHQALLVAGYVEPTPIQAASWPLLMDGHDLIAVAKTGSGKTCAFLLPLVLHIEQMREAASYYWMCREQKESTNTGVLGLVLAPTRELAIQIHGEALKFLQGSELQSMCSYGGTDVQPDLEQLCDRVPELIVGTPGRMILLTNRMPEQWLGQLCMLVLDEADRMLDMGFEDQVREIVAALPEHRQTAMFTATWPDSVSNLANEFLKRPVKLEIGQTGTLNAARSVDQVASLLFFLFSSLQVIEIVKDAQKLGRALDILAQHGHTDGVVPTSKALVFVNTKKGASWLSGELCSRGLYADSLHGDRTQEDRERVMAAFSNNQVFVLVSTDLAGRGIDVRDVSLVVNYEMPTSTGQQCMEDYIHRIGRTGRMDMPGTAVTLFDPKLDAKVAHELVNVLKGADQKVPPGLAELDNGVSVMNAAQKRGLEKSHKKRGKGWGKGAAQFESGGKGAKGGAKVNGGEYGKGAKGKGAKGKGWG